MKNLEGYNCYAFALNLEPVEISQGKWVSPLGTDIWDWIISGLLEENTDGELLVYFSQTSGEPIHMGIVEGDLIRSKWREEKVYLHHPDETPYGTQYKRYKMPKRDFLIKAWKKASNETIENLS